VSQNENLILIHGLLGSLSFFEPEKYLSEINVFTPDMYCYGNSTCLEDLSLQEQADYIEKIIIKEIKKPVWLLGHSVGGAIATILASKNPNIVKGLIHVEGNFTLNDAFWCQKIAKMDYELWKEEYRKICINPKGWLKESNIRVTSERETWANEILKYQTALSAQKVAKAVVSATGSVDYEEKLNNIIKNKIPVHLIAGEFSKDGWDVPKNYSETASSFTIVEKTGHMMMLEKPKEFCDIIQNIVKG
jgi:pimeloyl-ACP methyl ester carboxylesterase